MTTLPGSGLHDLTIAAAGELLRNGEISAVELTRALLERIERYDRSVNAFITVTAELALEQAAAADREIGGGRRRGRLHGIPFALKDLYDTAGVLTTANSKLYATHVPAHDATAVSRLYAAGGILLGKLKTHEFAQGGPATDLPWPPARNPWDTARFTGGSSSGSAAAVAAGFVPVSLGTDTGGSIRGPAALCGLAGLRPTYGLVSRWGVFPNSYTFDACGPIARTAEDCAIVLQAIAGFDANDPASARVVVPDYPELLRTDLRGLRIGVLRHFWEEDLPAHADVRGAMERALDVLRALGAELHTVRVRPLQEYYDVRNVIALSELMAVQHADLVERPDDYCMDFLGRGLAASLFQSLDYVEAQREGRRMAQELRALYPSFDAFVSPSSPGPAPKLSEYRTAGYWQRPNITTPFSITGGPALSVCNGFSEEGLPLGLQIGGKPFDDATVLAIGHAYERATRWFERRPALAEGPPPPIDIRSEVNVPAEVDNAMRQHVQACAQGAGLRLSQRHLEALYCAAPHALAMVRRLRRRRSPSEEPANVFKHETEEEMNR
ncbi:MAG TPA: amidase [Burkholderiales bacterium]|nr:amidase [Burkholderiales bacterium]